MLDNADNLKFHYLSFFGILSNDEKFSLAAQGLLTAIARIAIRFGAVFHTYHSVKRVISESRKSSTCFDVENQPPSKMGKTPHKFRALGFFGSHYVIGTQNRFVA